MTFDELLITQNIPEWAITSREIMRKAWDAATTAERDRCKEKCEELANDDEAPYKDYEYTYLNGWLDACNKCKLAIHGKSQPYTEDELSKAAKIGKAYFDNNKLIDIQIMGHDDKYS